jgi:hypothetical protein
MKVELQCGDTITIPEGCKAIVKDGSVVFEREEKEEERGFKDGDVLRSICDHEVLIFKKNTCSEYFSSHYNYSGKDNNMWLIDAFRHATEEEKQLLFDKMKEQGLQWNAEEKRVEKIRWRAEKGDRFYCFDTDFSVLDGLEEGSKLDDSSWRSYNYFRIVEQVEEAARRVQEALRLYHEEIGE